MPGSIIGELILQPLLEAALQVFGYWTGRIVIPTLSFGLLRIESVDRARRARPKWHGIHRAQGRGWVIDDNTTILLGLLFWGVMGIAAYVVFR